MRKLGITLGVVVVAAAGAVAAQPYGGGRDRITLYEGPNYTGRSMTFDRDISNLPREFNDRAGSVRVNGRWSVCVDSDYRGRCVDISRDVPDLRALGMDRTISSMRAYGYGGGYPGGGGGYPGGGGGYPGGGRERITLYEGPGFSGRSMTFYDNVSNLPRELNDRAMSARVSGRWSICVDSDYRGRCVDVNRDIADLRSLGMDRTISSMRAGGSYGGGGGYPGGGGWRRGSVTLFDGPNFTGRSIRIDQDYSNLPREFADRAISIRVEGRWQICADSDYRGRCVTVDRDVRDLRVFGLDRSISSLREEGRR